MFLLRQLIESPSYLPLEVLWIRPLSSAQGDADEARLIQSPDEKFQSVAFLFALKGGLFGIDRHYLGYKTIGMLKLYLEVCISGGLST